VKFLAKGKQVIYPEDYNTKVAYLKRSAAWIEEKKQEGIIECAYSYPSGTGFLIFNVESNQELTKYLIDFPLFCLSEFEVNPICNFSEYSEIVINEFVKLGVYSIE